jgi:hypothetical protein
MPEHKISDTPVSPRTDIAITPSNAINLIKFIFRTFEIRLIKKPGIDAR